MERVNDWDAEVSVTHANRRNQFRRPAFALVIALLLARPAHAQGPRVSFPEPVAAPVLLSADSSSIPPTNWAKGAVIGGAALGLFTGFLAAGFCGYDETGKNCTTATIGGFLVGAAIGAGLGAFIGARFPKHPKPAEAATN